MPPAPPDMRRIRRVLIVKLSAIGDAVHALPLTAALGEAYSDLEMTWVVEERTAPMVTGNPYLKEVIVLPMAWRSRRFGISSVRGFLDLSRDLRARRFDMALDLQGLSKSALIAIACGARYRYTADWPRELAPLLETRIPRRPESVHVVDQLLDVGRFLGATVGEVKFPLYIPPEDDQRAVELLREAGIDPERPFAAINPSEGGGGFKGWATERFASLLDDIDREPGIPAVIVGAASDRLLADAILKQARSAPVSLVDRTTLKQLAAVLRRAAVHVSGDTGSAHIAAAVGTPVVSIFGRTDPARLAPYGWQHLAIHHRELCAGVCRRYHERAPINRTQKCFAPPPVCLTAVTVSEVACTVRRALGARR